MNEKDKNKNEYFTDEDYLDLAGTSSATDCTGLISQGSNETDSAKQYNDLYQFGIPYVAAKAAGETSSKTSTSSTAKLSSITPTGAIDKSSYKASSNTSTNTSSKSSYNHNEK